MAEESSENGRQSHVDQPEGFLSSVGDSGEIYDEGEDSSEGSVFEVEIYEGHESIVADQGVKYMVITGDEANLAEEGVKYLELEISDRKEPVIINPIWGSLIQRFIYHNASQLTTHGQSCLRERLKERELCVFFRENSFQHHVQV
ncbi:OLC1v1036310C1 [Oldenlandia corymbosa var. corymbosa]|uniref:OLC1v1036310C1 n=1 Tax=Oldenlandia corymbosa var. corymbosa TaxID=529605 RepID=A0AAV1CWF8_OLDCO|nr:OLC1v1036310C1 [Oldenlandia corymbosa var. corymbosa]